MSDQADLNWNEIVLSELPFQSFDDPPITPAALPFRITGFPGTILPFWYRTGNSFRVSNFTTATPIMNLPEEITSLSNLTLPLPDNSPERTQLTPNSSSALWNRIQVIPFETDFSEAINEVKLVTEKYSGNECICSLCIEDIENGTDIYRLKCNHIFHARKCLDDKGIIDWINNHKTCPYCRAKIIVPSTANDPDEEEIEAVMDQAGASRENAIRALRRHGNAIDAILDLISTPLGRIGRAVNESEFNEEDIETIMAQASTSRENAIRALRQHGNVVDAILDLIP